MSVIPSKEEEIFTASGSTDTHQTMILSSWLELYPTTPSDGTGVVKTLVGEAHCEPECFNLIKGEMAQTDRRRRNNTGKDVLSTDSDRGKTR